MESLDLITGCSIVMYQNFSQKSDSEFSLTSLFMCYYIIEHSKLSCNSSLQVVSHGCGDRLWLVFIVRGYS